MRAVNDPHVVALVFDVEHGPSVRYRDDAPRVTHDETGFRLTLEYGTARFELKEHHATEEEALERVRPYVRNWEMDACLRGRPGDFRLHFRRAEIIDRDPPPPTPGTASLSPQPLVVGVTFGRPSLIGVKPAYPPPPSGLTLKADDPDVATMYQRLDGYYAGREPLPSMAYFCLTVLELPFKNGSGPRRRTGARYCIDKALLDEIGELSSTRGGAGSARKAAAGAELSRKEARFLEEAVKQLIRRAAEVAQRPGAAFPQITLASLPDRS